MQNEPFRPIVSGLVTKNAAGLATIAAPSDVALHLIDANIRHYEKRANMDGASDLAALDLPPGSTKASPVYTDPVGIEAAKSALAAGKPVWFVEGFASTTIRDRDREIILAEAFQKSLPRYMATNPMFLFAHDRREPLGSVIAAVIIKGAQVTVGEETFVTDGVWYKATCYDQKRGEQIENKVLRTSSVGFPYLSVDDVEFFELPDGRLQVVVRNIDIVEVSLEPTPCNFLSIVHHTKGLREKSIATKKSAAVTPPPSTEELTMKYSPEFKTQMGLDVNLTDDQVDQKLAEMRTKSSKVDAVVAKGHNLDELVTKAASADALTAKLWRKDFEGKIADSVLDDLESLPEAKRKSIAEKLLAEVEEAGGQGAPTPGGAEGVKNTALRGAGAGTAPAAKSAAAETPEAEIIRKGIGLFDKPEDVEKYALTSPAHAIKSVLGLTRITETENDRKAVEHRRLVFGLVAAK